MEERIDKYITYGDPDNVFYTEPIAFDVVEGNNTDKIYTCKIDHISKPNNRPISGEKYKKYWRKSKKAEKGLAERWVRNTQYKGINKKTTGKTIQQQLMLD